MTDYKDNKEIAKKPLQDNKEKIDDKEEENIDFWQYFGMTSYVPPRFS
jgi:hypothetical protein